MRVRLTTDPIDSSSLVEEIREPGSGAVVLFLGTVREMSDGKPVTGLEYEAHPSMALRQLEEITKEAVEKWRLRSAIVEHRYGRLELGDIAVAVLAASEHRAESFEAARWIMDTIKRRVPIWKKEAWADGSHATWVHPGLAESEKASP